MWVLLGQRECAAVSGSQAEWKETGLTVEWALALDQMERANGLCSPHWNLGPVTPEWMLFFLIVAVLRNISEKTHKTDCSWL